MAQALRLHFFDGDNSLGWVSLREFAIPAYNRHYTKEITDSYLIAGGNAYWVDLVNESALYIGLAKSFLKWNALVGVWHIKIK